MSEIREAQESDYYALLDLWGRVGLPYEPYRRESPQAFQLQLKNFGDCTLVIEENGKLIGSLIGTHDGRRGWINRLAVDPSFQKQGLASRLIERIESIFRTKGIAIFCAFVNVSNAPSRATFIKNSYFEKKDVIFFRKELK